MITRRTAGSWWEPIRFAVASTDALWRTAIASPPDKAAKGGLVVPLPPETDDATQAHLKAIACALARRGIARTVPTDVAVGIGPLGSISARLFSWLTGSPLILLSPECASLTDVVAACAGKRTALLCCDTHARTFGLIEISSALGLASVEFGFVYAFDMASALVAALKAALEPEPEPGIGAYLVNGAFGPELDESFGELHLACGTVVEPERMQELLAAPSRLKILVSHGNGFDFDLGRSVLCCIDGTVPEIDDPNLFPCFQTGACIRTAQARISIRRIQADLLVMATCWGVLDGAYEVDYARTAYAPLVTGPHVWSLMTAVRQWTAGPKDWLRLLGALSDGRSLGEMARRLNARLDPLHAAFLLFGNPSARLQLPAYLAQAPFETEGSAGHLSAGFRTIQIEPLAREERGTLFVCGDAGEPPKDTELFVERSISDEQLLVFCRSPFSVVWAPEQSPVSDSHTCQSFSLGAAVAARLVCDLGIHQGNGLTGKIVEARRLSMLLARALDGRRLSVGCVLLPQEGLAVALVDDCWRTVTREIVETWSAWATQGTRPRFWFEEWRRNFVQTAAYVGPICSSCGKRTRSQAYACVIEPAPDRVLTFCRICSTRSDVPKERAPAVAVRFIIDRGTYFEACYVIKNSAAHATLVGTAVYFMSATSVWQGCVSSPAVAWVDKEGGLEQTFKIPKPEIYIPGSHWFILLGLVNGVPFTHCERVVLRRSVEPGEHVWRHVPVHPAPPSDASGRT